MSSPVREPLGSKAKIEEIANLIAAIEPNEEENLEAEIEMPEPDSTETEELEAKMAEIGRFNEYDAYEVVWPEAGDKVLSVVWVKEFRSGVLKMRLCARPFGRPAHTRRSRDELYTPTPCMMSVRVLLAYAHRAGLCVRFFDVSRAFLHAPIRSRVLVPPRRKRG